MTKRKKQYTENKVAKVGETITCPICGTEFTKRQYSQAFCCSSCKDTFWNAKGDRHRAGYFDDYDNTKPERKVRRMLYGSTRVISVGGELTPSAQKEVYEHFLEKKHELEHRFGITID